MSSRTFCWAWDATLPHPAPKLVLLYVADLASMDGVFRPNIDQVASWSGLSRNEVWQALEELERRYLLIRVADAWLLPEEVSNEL